MFSAEGISANVGQYVAFLARLFCMKASPEIVVTLPSQIGQK
jgi:hypothetical protein